MSGASAPRSPSWSELVGRLVLLAAFLVGLKSPAWASKVVLKDGRVLEGSLAPLASMVDDPQGGSGSGKARLILMCDDGLRRIFVPKRQVREVLETDNGEVLEKFTVWQPVKRIGKHVHNVGQVIEIGPFDEFGRRRFTMNTQRGPVDVVQGITEITPRWTKVEGLSHVWDQRIATSSIPPKVLDQVLDKVIDQKKVEQRLKVARLYLQSERYKDARDYLEQMLKDFPQVKGQVAPALRRLRQLGAQRLLHEILMRRDAGQHRLATKLLSQFPAEGVAGETLREVREVLDKYQSQRQRGTDWLSHLDEHLAAFEDQPMRSRLIPVVDEIKHELNYSTLERLAPYGQFLDDDSLLVGEKLSLAVSGWLAGSGGTTRNLSVAMSMYELRNLVNRYMSEPLKLKRDRILEQIRSREGSDPQTMARLVTHMKPPLPLAEPDPEKPGLYHLTAPGYGDEPEFHYMVQLPPEYEPYRRYPAVVTLHGAGSTPEMQIDWWAGAAATEGPNQGKRLGQATRHGYLIIAPQWAQPKQSKYGFSAREHLAVLNSLRDACRRFSIDTDRIYLSGHSIGGDAAWDLGLAHPDLWAGVIPIVAESRRYCALYWENARYVPFYVVSGELDNDKPIRNARDLERYLRRGFDATAVEFLGRGHEHFSDEIQNLFDWMSRKRRDFFPREFATRSMRPWDNFFWWVEIHGLPQRALVLPNDWPPPRGNRPMRIEAKITSSNAIRVRAGAQRVTLWVTPQMFDLGKRLDIMINGSRIKQAKLLAEPDLEVLLEDVRTRGDRQHPFWARIDFPNGREKLAKQPR